MSATWYTWLEQKRAIKVSISVLDKLAHVLRLNSVERVQLFQLALRQPDTDSTALRETVSPVMQRVLDQMDIIAAFIVGPRWDVLAWNVAARAFFFDFEQVAADERNLVWLVFTNSALRSLMVDWPTRAQDVLARFRADYGRHAGEAHFVQLVERLNTVSPDFAEWWQRHDVRPQSEGRKRYRHPVAGQIVAEHITFSMTDDPELRVTVFSPVSESDSIAKMRKVIAAFGKGRAATTVSEGRSTSSPAVQPPAHR